jgi:hypothetical protein
MRLLPLFSIACCAAWCSAAPLQEQTRELLVGKWEDPKRPGNGWEFDPSGCFTASITAGVIRAHPKGTYRVLKDGSLEVRVKVGDQVARPRRYRVRVTKQRLILINKQGKETGFQRAR